MKWEKILNYLMYFTKKIMSQKLVLTFTSVQIKLIKRIYMILNLYLFLLLYVHDYYIKTIIMHKLIYIFMARTVF